jgi:hypothetical protein
MSYTIISGRYEYGSKDQQEGYHQLFGTENIQEKFDIYFHWFNLIHEVGHILVDLQNIELDQVEEELFANSFAVAYWRTVDKGDNLKRVQNIVEDILNVMPSPIPVGSSFQDYFKSIWGTEIMNSVMMYGYFQISCVEEAFKLNKSLKDVLLEVGYEDTDVSSLKAYLEEVNSSNSGKVLSECISNLNDIGIKIADVTIELVDNPEIQCCKSI